MKKKKKGKKKKKKKEELKVRKTHNRQIDR